MREINDNKRIGVPQGPAYARIISECFLDKIIQNFEAENDVPFVLYRYVDDIVVFYPTETNGKELYDELTHLLEINGLELNEDKSAFFGQLRDLTQDENTQKDLGVVIPYADNPVDDENVGENVIVEEFQKGYMYRNTVVRHSMVKVAN